VSTKSRADAAAAFEHWADHVQPDDVVAVDTAALRDLRQLADRRATLDTELETAVLAARAANRSWSEIGAMLGVSKQAAQRKYGRASNAA
jgi:DNA-directed RNA polymerase specialized sigma24 family protein